MSKIEEIINFPITRGKLFELGKERVEEFCNLNKIPIPKIIEVDREDWIFSVPAYYRPDTEGERKYSLHGQGVVICVDKCQVAAKPNDLGTRNWSWPGNIVDMTPYGVLCHELGHHCDWLTGENKGKYYSEYCEEVKNESKEKGITSYAETNPAEWFAEAFRLFVTNPNLLQIFRPKTFKILSRKWKPIPSLPWLEQLGENIPKRIVSSIINKGVRHD